MKDFTAYILCFCLSFSVGQDDIRLPPSIIKGPLKNIVYRSDGNITLECKGQGVPAIRYEWKKNGIDVNLNQGNIKLFADGTITIQPATSMDEGFYQCHVTNQYGTAVSNTSLAERGRMDSSASSLINHKMVREGDPFHIEAGPQMTFPKPIYGWETAINTVDRNPLTLKPFRRVQIADNGDLYFAYALPEDDLGGKIYKSTQFNPNLDQKSGGSYTNVTVTRGARLQIRPVLKYSSEITIVAVVGGNVSFRCIFGGYPDISTQGWSGPAINRQGGRVKYDPEKYNTELTVLNLTLEDAGNYTCSANNPIGTAEHSIQLLVEAIPSFKIHSDGPYDVNVTEGNDITFNCIPDAKPEATITWLQDGKPLDTNDPPRRYAFSNAKKSLTVSSVCRDCTDRDGKGTDLTVIQCNASNVHGYVFRSGYINVLKKTVVSPSEKFEKTVTMNEDQQFDFPCSAASDPSTPPTAKWYRLNEMNEEQLLHEDPPHLTIKDGTLTIRSNVNGTTNWKHFSAEYQCVAFNGYSRATQVVVLTVAESPETGAVASVADWWWLFLLIALIVIFLILILFCCLYIQRNKGDKYDVDEKERKNGCDPEKELIDADFLEYQRVEDQTLKGSQHSLASSAGSLNDYGDDPGKFTEDGSFVGAYAGTVDRTNRGAL